MPGNICVLCQKNLILDEEDVCTHCEMGTANANSKEVDSDTSLNCGSCNVFVEEDSESLYCEVCDKWFHNACLETPLIRDLYCLLNGAPNNVKWFCDKCIWITEKWIKTFPTITLNERRGKSRRFQTAVNNFKTLLENEPEYDATKEPEVKIEVDNDDVQFDTNDRHSSDSEEYGEKKKVKKKKKQKKNNIDNIDKSYECTFCGRHFHQAFLLNRHCIRVHPGLEPYKCDECDKAFFRVNKLKIHQKTHTGKKPFPCNLCDRSFTREGWLEKHTLWHTSDNPWRCKDCEMCFETQDILKEHQRTHIGDKNYVCSHCGQSFNRRRTFLIHERIHTGEKPHKCKYCDERFGDPDVHKKHQYTHPESKIHQCSHCGKSFSRHDHLKKHERIHTGEKNPESSKIHQCSHCGKSFSRHDHFIIHERIHTGEKPFICSQCGKGFRRKDHLKNHERAHNGEKPYHNGEKPFICGQCGKSFTRKDHLRKHEMYHTGEKPYQCNYCGKEFVRLDNLKAHEKIHTGEKPTKLPNPQRKKAALALQSPQHFKTEISNDSHIAMPIFTQQNSIQPLSPTSMAAGPSRNSLSSHNPNMPSSTPYTLPMSSPFLQSRPMLNNSSNHPHPTPNFNPLHQMPIRLMSNQQLSQIEGWSNVGRWVNSGTWAGNYEDSN